MTTPGSSYLGFVTLLFFVGLAGESAGQSVADSTGGVIEVHAPAEWTGGALGVRLQTGRSLYLAGRVDHPNGVIRTTASDVPLIMDELSDGSWGFEGWIPVDAGADSVRITAMTRNGEAFQRSFPIAVQLPDATASEAEIWNSATAGFQGERWAVVVGISEYEHSGIQNLRYADRDAEQFAQFLVSDRAGLGGFDPDNVLLLTNEDATYRRLRGALYEWLKQPTEDDIVYIFWAGHGTPDPDRLHDLYLLPYDAEPDNIASTAIPMEDLQDALDRTLARDKIIITDACHSAGVGFRGTRALQGVNQINAAFLDGLALSTGGTVSLTSSMATELSQEGPTWGGGHGVFTYFLLQGLYGAADTNADGIVDVVEMYEFARENVRRETRNAQTPTMSQSPFNTSWPMAAVLDGPVAQGSLDDLRRDETVSAGRSAMVIDLIDGTWSYPDSLNAFVGVQDTVKIRLGGRAGPVVDGSILSWTSSNESVARVLDDGTLHAVAPGMTTISASYFSEKRVEIATRVFDRPLQVEFAPRDDTLRVVRSDQVRLSAAMQLPSGQIIRGVLPGFEILDSLVVGVSRNADEQIIEGQFRALREGTARVRATLAGYEHEWVFQVESPGLLIQGVPTTLLTGSEVDVRAHYSKADGSLLDEAFGVTWESTDSSVVEMRLGGIVARRPGQADLIASVGATRDTVSISVLGDLILTTERDGRARIETYALERQELTPILADEYGGTDAVLSPDGASIAFLSQREEDPAPRVYVMSADGSGLRQLVEEKGSGLFGLRRYYETRPAWSQDGSRIYFSSNRDGDYDIYAIPVDGNMNGLTRLTEGRSVERNVTGARDGPSIAYERVVDVDDSDVLFALGDGGEEINLTQDRVGENARGGIHEGKPAFVPGSGELLLVEENPGTGGEALIRFDLSARQRVAVLVEAQRGQEIVFAVSPLGDRVAYQQRPKGGGGDGRVVVIDLEGRPLQTFTLPAGLGLQSLSWGAVSTNGSFR